MKRLSRATTAVDFISQATSGEMKKEKKQILICQT